MSDTVAAPKKFNPAKPLGLRAYRRIFPDKVIRHIRKSLHIGSFEGAANIFIYAGIHTNATRLVKGLLKTVRLRKGTSDPDAKLNVTSKDLIRYYEVIGESVPDLKLKSLGGKNYWCSKTREKKLKKKQARDAGVSSSSSVPGAIESDSESEPEPEEAQASSSSEDESDEE